MSRRSLLVFSVVASSAALALSTACGSAGTGSPGLENVGGTLGDSAGAATAQTPGGVGLFGNVPGGSTSGGSAGAAGASAGLAASGGSAGGSTPAGGGAAPSPGGTHAGAATTAGSGGGEPSNPDGVGGHAGLGGASPAPRKEVDLFLAGDSTVQTYPDTGSSTDQAGWGQMLGERAVGPVVVHNQAIGGRTARRFIDEGRLDAIAKELTEGDYLLVQFGTNDGNRTAMYSLNGESIPYYLDPATDFKRYLERYIEIAKSKGATPVLVTPPPRNSAYCTGGNGTGAHASAMRELGQEKNVSVVDLNQRSVEYLKAICPAPTPEDFFLLRADGSVDGTHFQEHGARLLAGFVLDELERLELPLATYFE